jgi:hypothetical protein
MSGTVYGARAELSCNAPKVMQKAIEEHSKWNVGFNTVFEKYSVPELIFSVTFERQGEDGLE